AIERHSFIARGTFETERIIGLQTQRLMHVGKDPCRDQRSVEEETGIGEVVQTIDLEWITLVEEPIAIVHPTLDRAFVVEHIALARAVELGIRRELLLLQAAFIAGIIDLQRSRYL